MLNKITDIHNFLFWSLHTRIIKILHINAYKTQSKRSIKNQKMLHLQGNHSKEMPRLVHLDENKNKTPDKP